MSNTRSHVKESTVVSLTGTLVEPTVENLRPSDGDESQCTLFGPDSKEMVNSGREQTPKCPPVIPPPSTDHSGRTLVVCFDGTGDQFDNDNSNVVKLLSLLKKDDRSKQLVYYQSGIGTYTSPEIASPIRAAIWKKIDIGFAWNLDSHIMGGYEFLMQSYITGDKICIFGFSRGAYTARCLAGMLHKVGLLPAGNFQQVPFAYRMYIQADPLGWELSNEFRKAYCINVSIEFLGVWDTVDSVGIFPKRLPFTTSNTIVKTFRHAVALDERRAKFKANLWNRPTQKEIDEMRGISGQLPPTPNIKPEVPAQINMVISEKSGTKQRIRRKTKEDREYRELGNLERMNSEKLELPTDVEEVWFAGCHCDIGGGSVSNRTRFSLARIPLRWMVRECFKSKTGILFNSNALFDIGMDPSTLYPKVLDRPPSLLIMDSCRIEKPPPEPIPIRLHASHLKLHALKVKLFTKLGRPLKVVQPPPYIPYLGSEEEEELHDILSPKYDQLKLTKGWWVLEYLPLPLRYQRGDDEWVSHIKQNKGAPRIILEQEGKEFKVHRTVKMRTEAQFEDEASRRRGKRYVPKPVFPVPPMYVP